MNQELPHVEQSVLGAILTEGAAWDQVADKLTENHFTTDYHRRIFRAMSQLAKDSAPIDIITVETQLKAVNEDWEKGGAFAYLASLAKNSTGAANINHYAGLMMKSGTVRRLNETAEKIAALTTEKLEPSEMIDKAEGMLFEIQQGAVRGGGPRRMNDVLASFFNSFDDDKQKPIETGFMELDRMLSGGMRGGELIVVAGRPGSGKTTLGMNIVEFVGTVLKKGVLVFSMEMQAEALAERLIASMASIDLSTLRTKDLSKIDMGPISAAIGVLSMNTITIDPTEGLRPSELRARARREKRTRPLDLIMVDYLQLMKSDTRYENRVNEIGEISGSLKGLAKELNIPVIALAQLNRNSVIRADKKPTMADLRDSGSIEQDSDVVALVHREEMFNPTPDNEGMAEIIIDKQRNGETGVFTLKFNKRHNKFVNFKRF